MPAAGLATLLAVPVIVVDLFGGFSRDINVPPPQSLLFYPLMALVAEFVFHVIPLGTVSVLAVGHLPNGGVPRARSAALVFVSMIEPVLQVVWGAGHSPGWANAYVGAHVLIINLLGLYLFARYDFFSMYFFRAAYYLLWHITWGALRLPFLFGG